MDIIKLIETSIKVGKTLIEIYRKLQDDGYKIPYVEVKKEYNKIMKNKGGK